MKFTPGRRGIVVSLRTALNSQLTPAASYERWLLTLGTYNHAWNTYEITEPMPPIRCTMPVPCGVCWYCKQHEARNA